MTAGVRSVAACVLMCCVVATSCTNPPTEPPVAPTACVWRVIVPNADEPDAGAAFEILQAAHVERIDYRADHIWWADGRAVGISATEDGDVFACIGGGS